MKKKIIAATVASGAIGLAGIVGVASASGGAKPASLVDELAQKFSLNTGSVQQVFNQHKQEMLTFRQQRFFLRLDKAVSSGKISSAQESAIKSEYASIQSFVQSLAGKTPEQRQQAIQAERLQVQSWAKANNIPSNLAPGFGGMGLRGRHGQSAQ